MRPIVVGAAEALARVSQYCKGAEISTTRLVGTLCKSEEEDVECRGRLYGLTSACLDMGLLDRSGFVKTHVDLEEAKFKPAEALEGGDDAHPSTMKQTHYNAYGYPAGQQERRSLVSDDVCRHSEPGPTADDLSRFQASVAIPPGQQHGRPRRELSSCMVVGHVQWR